ncbi:hypothetical protein ASF44_07985 [Pseudorhodoferax sp. Leaf274]|nr:hypothetical protein ASF44_07985 [Pseudorhodoferax sp. Leaf274]
MAVGMKPKAFYHWESGHATPDIFKLKTLARLYGMTLDEVVTGESDWPLAGVSLAKIQRLDQADKVRLETAILLAAATIQLDVVNMQSKQASL